MAYANFLELERCLDQCIAYCEAHPEHDFVEHYEARLRDAKRRFYKALRETDEEFVRWQDEAIDDKRNWKRLALELKSTQKMLRRVNAINSPQDQVMYWDQEILTSAVEKMLAYLRRHEDAIEEASDRIDKLQRYLDAAQSEDIEADEAFDDFSRTIMFRSQALGTVNSVLGDFRRSMRNVLGKRDAGYRAIDWPMSIAPDQAVL